MHAELLGHSLAVKSVTPGEKLTYYSASGWSNGGVEDMEEWQEEIAQQQAMVLQPLKVIVAATTK